ncbi:MAG: class I SAM-dependent methyltransferase [Candidatus Marsarchaeota archaeon]|nr:class I SAM-dependent methyltransferase [Candidatus Marsarchaeota archaeon]
MKKQSWQEKWNATYGLNKDPNRELLLFPLLLNISKPIKGKLIADLGCGNGSLVVKLLRYAPKKIYGIDFSSNFLKFATDNIRDKRVTFIKSDIRRRLPLKSNSVDIVYCTFVFNETKNINLILKEVSRILKKRGRFYLMTTHPFFPMKYYLYEKYTGKKNDKILNVKGYFENFEGKFNLTMAKQTPPFYHHRVEDLINSIINNNLSIRRVNELSTNKKMINADPRYKEQSDMPKVILISAEK